MRDDQILHKQCSTKENLFMVLLSVTEKETIAPDFYESRVVNLDTYEQMLREFAFPKPRSYPENTIFQLDDVPLHFHLW